MDKRLRFVARELSKAPMIATYRVSNGLRICIRHEGIDSFVMDEVYGSRIYEPPLEADAVLRALSRPPRILDLGANIGLFGIYACGRFPGAQVTAFEADPLNAAVHRRCMAMNGSALDWQLVEAFASTRSGHVWMNADGSPLSRAVDPDDSTATLRVPRHDVLPLIAQTDLVKLDIEGAEWPILRDPRLRLDPPGALVLEYHRLGCPDPRPDQYARRLLEDIGYTVWKAPEQAWAKVAPDPAGLGVLWGWRNASGRASGHGDLA